MITKSKYAGGRRVSLLIDNLSGEAPTDGNPVFGVRSGRSLPAAHPLTCLHIKDHHPVMARSKKFMCLMLALLSAQVPSPSRSNTPPPIYPHDYDGPYIVCRPGIAVPVKAGERLHNVDSTDMLYFSEGELVIDTFTEDPECDADIVHFRGTSDVPDLGLVTRYELTSRKFGYRAIGYVYDTGKPYFTGHYRVLFRSPQFTGSDLDKALLTRAVSGEGAIAMCPQRGD